MTKEDLFSLYTIEKLSLRDIAKLYKTTHHVIRRELFLCGIKEFPLRFHYRRFEVQCDYCKKPLFRTPGTVHKIRGNFCSYECMHNWQKEGGMAKEKAPCWKGGITAISSNNLKTPEFRELKKIVLRNFPICVMCGNTTHLHAHHIKNRREYPELCFEKSNCITVCRSCHAAIKGKEKSWENFFMRIVRKGGELLENPNSKEKDNQQPSLSNVRFLVDRKVQRLTGEDSQTNKPDTSAAPERDDIVRAYGRP